MNEGAGAMIERSCREGRPRRFSRLVFGAVVVMLAALAWGCTLFPEEPVEEIPALIEPPPSRVVTYEAKRQSIVEEVRGLARVAPTRETNLYFTQSGRLFELYAGPGDRVEEGQVLARLETGPLAHQLKLAEIDLELARLRLEEIRTRGAPLDVRMQELAVERSSLEVEYLKERIERATLRAPYDGVVRSVRIQPGELVEEYATLIVVGDPQAMELRMEIRNIDEVNKVARGQTALVEVGRDRWEKARVEQITTPSAQAGAFSTARLVHLAFDESPVQYGLRLDDLATVRIAVQEREDVVVIPRAALREFMGRTYVRVLDGESRREVDVAVGIRTPTEVEILGGIDAGTIVIGQ